ncbi:hypothetical protein Taro_051632, partial [Colocasia esculenta]|nr:hypothetical protein [Colocasia esculenta]
GQTFLAKVVSTYLLLVSTQCFKAKAECCRNGEVVSTLDQVDTLWKLCDLKSLLECGTLGIWWIGLGSCAHDPQGYFWTLWTINTLLIGHPTTREPPRAFQKSFWQKRELSSLFLLPLCFSNPIPTSPSTRSEY